MSSDQLCVHDAGIPHTCQGLATVQDLHKVSNHKNAFMHVLLKQGRDVSLQ